MEHWVACPQDSNMPSFALITEGITDQVALKAILEGHYGTDDFEVNPLQPLRDTTDAYRQAGFAGWELVLEFCANRQRLSEALAYNEYVIIQIDTDCGDHVNYGVPLTVTGQDKRIDLLVEEVKNRIIRNLDPGLYNSHSARFFFAVCVHSLECWLLPLRSNLPADLKRTKSCEKHLARACKKSNESYEKKPHFYDKLSADCATNKGLASLKSTNESLKLFLDSLPEL